MTLSPGAIPSLADRPPLISRTPKTGSAAGIVRSEWGSVFSAMLAIVPQHIQWNKGVLHPHHRWLRCFKVEQHAAVSRQIGAIHEPTRPLFVRPHNLHLEGHRPFGRLDCQGFKRILRPCTGPTSPKNKSERQQSQQAADVKHRPISRQGRHNLHPCPSRQWSSDLFR